MLKQNPSSHQGGSLATLITALILFGRMPEAEALIRDAAQRGDRGGYTVGPRSFIAMAGNWLAVRGAP